MKKQNDLVSFVLLHVLFVVFENITLQLLFTGDGYTIGLPKLILELSRLGGTTIRIDEVYTVKI